MEAAEHREPCESRGSCTDLGAPGGEIPPGDSTIASHPDVRDAPGMSAMPPIATQSVRRNEASRCANTGRRTERVGLSRLKSLSKQSRTRCIASAVSSHADVGKR